MGLEIKIGESVFFKKNTSISDIRDDFGDSDFIFVGNASDDSSIIFLANVEYEITTISNTGFHIREKWNKKAVNWFIANDWSSKLATKSQLREYKLTELGIS